MKISRLMIPSLAALSCFVMCTTAFAQSTCSEEDLSALGECKASCEAQYPACEDDKSVTDTLEDKCGSCSDNANYGKFNSCAKKVIKGLKLSGQLNDENKEELRELRKDCKQEKKEEPKGDKGDDSKEGGDDEKKPKDGENDEGGDEKKPKDGEGSGGEKPKGEGPDGEKPKDEGGKDNA